VEIVEKPKNKKEEQELKKKTLLMAILSIVLTSVMLFSAIPIKIMPVSAQCPDLLAEAETYASAGNPDHDFTQAYNWAYNRSGDSWNWGTSKGAIIAESSVYVWRDAQGNVWGPYPQNWNGWREIGIYASVIYLPPLTHPNLNAYSVGRYYSDGSPLYLDCRRGGSIAFGGRSNMHFIGGIMVQDDTGIIYDVAIECWSNATVPSFTIIENVGTWPNPWNVTNFTGPSGKGFIYATMDPFEYPVSVTGCANATWYLNVTISQPSIGGSSQVIDAAEITSSEEEDSFEATFKIAPVGGIAEFPQIEEPGTVTPDLSDHNYGALAGIIVGAIVGTIMLISAVWYIRRRRTKAI